MSQSGVHHAVGVGGRKPEPIRRHLSRGGPRVGKPRRPGRPDIVRVDRDEMHVRAELSGQCSALPSSQPSSTTTVTTGHQACTARQSSAPAGQRGKCSSSLCAGTTTTARSILCHVTAN